MSTWEDPFNPDVPIDVDRVAIAIMLAVTSAVGDGNYILPNKVKAEIIDRVREILKTYDDLRSKNIAYLRDEVLKLHNLNVKHTVFKV